MNIKIGFAMVLVVSCVRSSEVTGPVVGSCVSISAFNEGRPDCREFVGSTWTEALARKACDDLTGTYTGGLGCPAGALGACVLGGGTERATRIIPEGPTSSCVAQQRGCEVFGGGVWKPFAGCGGVNPDDNGETGLPPFIQPTLVCRDAIAGERPGASDGGQVCTWQGTQGCTEPGRNFADYASCDVVRTQRPAGLVPINTSITGPDSRLSDPAFVAEASWVKSQISSCSCVCCHSNRSATGQSAKFTLDGPRWYDSFFDSSLAAGAGYIESSSFGHYEPGENNGFIRDGRRDGGAPSIFASTDPARMARFFQNELAARRPRVRRAFGRPAVLHAQPVTQGEGVGPDGRVVWKGGRARYVYVLEADAVSPTVPPRQDLPAGTLWRVDVSPKDSPLSSGSLRYGEAPEGATQTFPLFGNPAPLVSGNAYYLYVTVDVLVPVTRCLFIAP
jgi:predicted CxxxxCH...CXXCH cytochrome family protein